MARYRLSTQVEYYSQGNPLESILRSEKYGRIKMSLPVVFS